MAGNNGHGPIPGKRLVGATSWPETPSGGKGSLLIMAVLGMALFYWADTILGVPRELIAILGASLILFRLCVF